jgi:hypothetical protein
MQTPTPVKRVSGLLRDSSRKAHENNYFYREFRTIGDTTSNI